MTVQALSIITVMTTLPINKEQGIDMAFTESDKTEKNASCNTVCMKTYYYE